MDVSPPFSFFFLFCGPLTASPGLLQGPAHKTFLQSHFSRPSTFLRASSSPKGYPQSLLKFSLFPLSLLFFLLIFPLIPFRPHFYLPRQEVPPSPPLPLPVQNIAISPGSSPLLFFPSFSSSVTFWGCPFLSLCSPSRHPPLRRLYQSHSDPPFFPLSKFPFPLFFAFATAGPNAPRLDSYYSLCL